MANFCGLTGCLLSGSKSAISSHFKPLRDSPGDAIDHPAVFPIPLKDAAIYAEVRGFATSITASLTYENMLDETVECQLVIPVDEATSMAIHRLEADVDSVKIRGECRSRETAIEIYSTAFDNSYNGVLLEGQVPSNDAVRLWLGHLKPKGVAVITLGIVKMLRREHFDGVYSATIPSILNPRYVPDFDEIILACGDDSNDLKARLNFPVDSAYIAVTGCAYSIGFEAKINLGAANRIAVITASSPTDELNIRYLENNRTAIVNLAGPFSADHDLQLLITPTEISKPIIYFEPGLPPKTDGKHACKWLPFHMTGVWFEPFRQSDYEISPNNTHNSNGYSPRSKLLQQTSNNSNLDPGSTSSNRGSTDSKAKRLRDTYWIVVERSESIDDQKLEEMKSAMIIFIKSLPFGCKFNIIGFGSTYSPLFDKKPVAYSEKSVVAALKYVINMQANLGSTDMLEPLKHIYKQHKKKKQKRKKQRGRCLKNEFIFLLTDGEIGNVNDVLALAAKNAARSRFFTVGLGDKSNRVLIDGLARDTNGISTYAHEPDEPIAERVVSLLKIARNPTASNVDIDWSFSNHRIARMIPEQTANRVYDNCPIIQYVLIENQPGASSVDGTSTVSADICDETFTLQTNFNCPSSEFSPLDDTMPMHRLAAKARLAELSSEALCSGLMIESLRKEAVAISITTGIVSDFTSLICVDANTGVPLKKNSPIFAIPESKVSYYVDDDGVAYHFGREHVHTGSASHKVKEAFNSFALCKCSANSNEDDFFVMADSKGTMEFLIATQRLNGSWKMTLKFTKYFGVNVVANSINELRQQCLECYAKVRPPIAFGDGVTDDFIATTLAIAILRHQFSTRRREFELVDQKAACFLFNSNNSASNDTNANFMPAQLTQFINIAVVTFHL